MEEQITQTKSTEKIVTPASYMNRINKQDKEILNNTFIKTSSYDIEFYHIKMKG